MTVEAPRRMRRETPIQPSLFDNPAEMTIQARFEAFDRAHPDVYQLFRGYACELLESGRQHYGAKSIIERIRWHYAVSRGGDEFKLNNNFTSRYVRKLVGEDPRFADFFERRELRAE